jgi:hypothetical protein
VQEQAVAIAPPTDTLSRNPSQGSVEGVEPSRMERAATIGGGLPDPAGASGPPTHTLPRKPSQGSAEAVGQRHITRAATMSGRKSWFSTGKRETRLPVRITSVRTEGSEEMGEQSMIV